MTRREQAEVLWQRFERRPDGCWQWTGHLRADGYGSYGKRGRLAHRLMYEMLVGPIPEGLTLDHRCRNHGCVNPAHLDPTTIAENVMRGEGFAPANAAKTECPHGHPYDEVNTWRNAKGHRHCRACNRDKQRRRAAR